MKAAGILAALLASLALAAPAGAASIKGTWRGTYHVVKGGSGSAAVKVRITRLKKGSKAGTVSYPGSRCHGNVVLRKHTRKGYTFRYHERARSGCTGDDTVLMRRKGAGLFWRATSPGGGQVGLAVLRRVR